MKPEETGKAYDSITDRWAEDRFNMNNGIRQHQLALKFAKGKGAALDVGCGRTGRFISLLLAQGYSPQGIDISENMLQLAKEKHPDIPFYHADICSWVLPEQYHFITAWDSLWHLPLTQQAPVLHKLMSNLVPGGIFIFSFGGTDEPGEHENNAMGPTVSYSSLGTTGFLDVVKAAGCVCKHLEFDQYPELHTYLIAQKR